MAKKLYMIMAVAMAAFAVQASARTAPTTDHHDHAGAGLNDQKNFLNYGGLGGFSGIGDNGLPFGGIGGAVGLGVGHGGLGGASGLGGLGRGVGGYGGGGIGGIGAGIGGGALGGIGGGGLVKFP